MAAYASGMGMEDRLDMAGEGDRTFEEPSHPPLPSEDWEAAPPLPPEVRDLPLLIARPILRPLGRRVEGTPALASLQEVPPPLPEDDFDTPPPLPSEPPPFVPQPFAGMPSVLHPRFHHLFERALLTLPQSHLLQVKRRWTGRQGLVEAMLLTR